MHTEQRAVCTRLRRDRQEASRREHESNQCVKRRVHCRFAQYGCTSRTRSRRLEAHNAEMQTAHMNMLVGRMNAAALRSNANAAPNDEVQKKLAEMRDELRRIVAEQAVLKEQLAELTNAVERSRVASTDQQAVGNEDDAFANLNGRVAHLEERIAVVRANGNAAAAQAHEVAAAAAALNAEAEQRAASEDVAPVDLGNGEANADGNAAAMIERNVMDTTSFNGILIWKFNSFRAKREDARSDRKLFCDSPPFFTSKFGYKMMVRVYPNGDGASRGTHLSVFFVLLRGDYDDLLFGHLEEGNVCAARRRMRGTRAT